MAGKASPPPDFSETALTQVRQYAAEYRHGAFAVNAVTQDVATVGGRTPESFESITRRYIAERPNDFKPSFAARLKIIFSFLKTLATRTPDMSAIEKQKDLPRLKSPTFCLEDAEWRESHF